jgi:hypothetical protein
VDSSASTAGSNRPSPTARTSKPLRGARLRRRASTTPAASGR